MQTGHTPFHKRADYSNGYEIIGFKEKKAKLLQDRISQYGKEVLTCLGYDNVLPQNDTAERALRNQVVMRKIFGGSRSVNGAKVHGLIAVLLIPS